MTPCNVLDLKNGDIAFIRASSVDYIVEIIDITKPNEDYKVDILHKNGVIRNLSVSAYVAKCDSHEFEEFPVANPEGNPDVDQIVKKGGGVKWVKFKVHYKEKNYINGTVYVVVSHDGFKYEGSGDTRYENGILTIHKI